MKNFSWQVKGSLATSMFGAVVVGAISILGVPESVKSATVTLGSDYFQTAPGAFFTFGNPINQTIPFVGVPIDPVNSGSADTIVERKTDCVLPGIGSSCTTNIEMIELSLKSQSTVNFNGFNYDVFVSLDNSMPSTGTLDINHQFPDNNTPDPEGTASSMLNVFFEAMFVEDGGNGSNDFSVFDSVTFNALGNWSHEPGVGSLVGPNSSNFFWVGTVNHTAPGHSHPIKEPVPCQPGEPCPPPVPEPASTALGSAMLLGVGTFFKRKISKKGKPNWEE